MGEEKGVVSYDTSYIISTIAFIMLMKKHGSQCIVHNLGGKWNVGINVNTNASSGIVANNIQHPYLANELGIFLMNCVRRGVSVICIPMEIWFEGDDDETHINMLIYRPLQKTVERFEPHGSGETLNEFDDTNNINNRINQQLETLWEVNLSHWIGNVTYIPSNVTCPRIYGLQSLENNLEFIGKEEGGFCYMWAIFMAEMALLNPEKTTKTILEEIFSITKSNPFFIKSIICGYVLEIEHELDLLFKQIGKVGFTYDRDSPGDQLFDTPDIGVDSIGSTVSDFENANMHRLDRWIINALG